MLQAQQKNKFSFWLDEVAALSTSFNLASRDIQAVLKPLLAKLVKDLKVAAIAVWTVEPGTNFMKIEASAGLEQSYIRYFNKTDRIKVGKSLVGRVMQEQRTLATTNIKTERLLDIDRWRKILVEYDYNALIASPMFIGKKIVGAFEVYYKKKKSVIEKTEQQFLEIVANQVAVTIENIRNYETIERAHQDLLVKVENLLGMQRLTALLNINFYKDIKTAFDDFAKYVVERFGAKGMSIFEYNQENNNLLLTLASGLSSSAVSFLKSHPFDIAPGTLSAIAFQENEVKTSPKVFTDDRIAKHFRTLLSIERLSSLAIFLLTAQEEKLGTLAIYWEYPHEFSKEELASLTLLSHYTSTLLLNVRIFGDLDAEKNKTLATINSLQDGIIVFDLENRIASLNPRAEELLEIRAGQVLGKKAENLDEAQNPKLRPLKTVSHLELAELESREITISFPSEKIFIVTAVPLRGGETLRIGSIRIIHDITREVEVEGLHRSFVAIASHQFRTSLTGIRWMLDGMLLEEFGKLTREQKYYVQNGLQAANRLTTIVNDLVLVSHMDVGSFEHELSSFDIFELIKQIGSEIYASLSPDKKKIKWEAELLEKKLQPIISDKKKLGLVLTNIIDNSFSFTRQGAVKATVRFENVLKKSVVVAVRDTGIGIPKKDQKHLFVKFFRAPNAVLAKPDGSGLGLFIANEIIKRLNGKIWFESEEGKGTTFYVMVPLKLQSAKSSKE